MKQIIISILIIILAWVGGIAHRRHSLTSRLNTYATWKCEGSSGSDSLFRIDGKYYQCWLGQWREIPIATAYSQTLQWLPDRCNHNDLVILNSHESILWYCGYEGLWRGVFFDSLGRDGFVPIAIPNGTEFAWEEIIDWSKVPCKNDQICWIPPEAISRKMK